MLKVDYSSCSSYYITYSRFPNTGHFSKPFLRYPALFKEFLKAKFYTVTHTKLIPSSVESTIYA